MVLATNWNHQLLPLPHLSPTEDGMSHINDLRHKCLCGNRADFEVINNRSAALGIYCKRHAESRLKEFDQTVTERIKRGEAV